MQKKLAIVTTHPIQYNAPLFQLLGQSRNIELKVFYTWEQSEKGAKYDPGFGKKIEWDIPLLDGYDYTFVKNIASDPGTHHFTGIKNPTLNKEIEKWNPDAVMVIGWSFYSHLNCMRHFHKKMPVLFRGDSILLTSSNRIKKYARTLFLKWVYRYVDKAFYVGTNNKAYFLRHGLKEFQLVYAPHAIDNDRFGEPEIAYQYEAANLKKDLKINDGSLVVLLAGKLEEVKNPFFIIELAKQLKGMGVTFIVAGNGPLEESLKEKAKNLSNIIFLDFQNQMRMPVIYRLADIYIMSSKSETWGLGANEAMASGCVVMLSDNVGGAIDLVKENSNGIIFNVADIEKCKSFIIKLSYNRELLNNMKQSSKKLIKNFSFQQIINSIEAVGEKN